MVFFASARGVDVFWSPLSVTVLGGLILAILLRNGSTDKEAIRRNKGLTLTEVKNLIQSELDNRPRQQSIHVQSSNSKNQSGNDDFFGFFVIGLVFLSVGYARYQNQVLDYSVVAATSLFGFWVATILFSLFKGTISGRGWATYTIVVCVLSLLALPILYLSLNPIYAPDGITNLQQVATDSGFFGLIKNYGAEGVSFLFFQVIGFFVLYGSWLFILLSLIYMASSTLVVSGARGRQLWFWLSIKTSKFGKPVKGTIIVSILYLVSFFLISGLVYKWLLPVSNL
ncbi:hypothetical protein ACET9U_00905 [Aeromonas veronii]